MADAAGAFFVISVHLQTNRPYNAIQAGLILTPATLGILAVIRGRRQDGEEALAEIPGPRRLSRDDARHGPPPGARPPTSSVAAFVPGPLLSGLGPGVMLTASVNAVQSSFPGSDQGEISGPSRSVSNLGSSLGTGIVGSIPAAATGGRPPFNTPLAPGTIAFIGLGAAILLPPAHRAQGGGTGRPIGA